MPRACAHCQAELPASGRLYCDPRCKMRATRRRKAGLPEDAFPDGFVGGSFRVERKRRAQHAEYLRVVLPDLRL
jgi:hypothetical protein